MKVTLHIERLVLDGLPAAVQSSVLQVALERELSTLLARRGITGLSGATSSQLIVPAIQLPAGSRPAQWGQRIAQSLAAGLFPATPAHSVPAPSLANTHRAP